MREKSYNRDTRLALIEAGIQIMFEKGYSNTGILDVLALAGVPKGSFYHYFSSKEDFGLKVIDYFGRKRTSQLFNLMKNSTKSPAERLIAFCENARSELLEKECRGGCLIGNLCQEMSDQNENLRRALSDVIQSWHGIVAECIAEGQAIGELNQLIPADLLAEAFLSSWNGALMQSKVTKDVEPINTFIGIFFDFVLIPFDSEHSAHSAPSVRTEVNDLSFATDGLPLEPMAMQETSNLESQIISSDSL